MRTLPSDRSVGRRLGHRGPLHLPRTLLRRGSVVSFRWARSRGGIRLGARWWGIRYDDRIEICERGHSLFR
ncbi:unnamed protein product [[Actinomadura] parvosata subsp. kistnae]|nr:unnamed protein product [Actinomadura parvosata subsp. kistnae]